MQRATTWLTRWAALLGLAVVLLTTWSALPLGQPSTGVATLAVAVLAAVALAVVLPRRGAGLAPTSASRRAMRRDRLAPARRRGTSLESQARNSAWLVARAQARRAGEPCSVGR